MTTFDDEYLAERQEIYVREVVDAADELGRYRAQLSYDAPLDPQKFFTAAHDICQRFHQDYAPDGIENLMSTEIMEGIAWAVRYIKHGPVELH